MNDATNLNRLHDIVVPEPIPWWPPAPGWFVLMAVACCSVAFLAYFRWKRWRANAYRRAALQELATADSVFAISEVLRRTALVVLPREKLSSLTGASWPSWLEKTSPIPMPEPVRERLAIGIYGATTSTADLKELKQFASDWIKQHQSLGRSETPDNVRST